MVTFMNWFIKLIAGIMPAICHIAFGGNEWFPNERYFDGNKLRLTGNGEFKSAQEKRGK